jgi:hypothetical protein
MCGDGLWLNGLARKPAGLDFSTEQRHTVAPRAVAKESKAPLIKRLRQAIRDGSYVIPSGEIAAEFAQSYYARNRDLAVARRPLPLNLENRFPGDQAAAEPDL